MKLSRETISIVVLFCAQQTSAFTVSHQAASRSFAFGSPHKISRKSILRASTTESLEAFADSLEEDDEAGLFDDADDADAIASWQEQLEMLLDPDTPMAKRQILLSDLVSSNESIRQDVQKAVSERNIDPILTPTGKKLQDGTRAVARQITTDIIPGLADIANTISSGRAGSSNSIVDELPSLVPKVGERVLDAMRTTAKKNLETLQGDLADPSRIPGRLSKQRADIEAEVRNIFLETPVGLQEPEYSVIEKGLGYEIRQYEGYTAAATSMSKIGESVSVNDLTSGGAAFNSLAAYLFGANEDEKGMEMTTPVTTTSDGEMRFYLKNDGTMQGFPTPLAVEDKLNEKGAVKLIEVPPARLAVARFTGFVTDGEVARQKDALLSALAADGVEIDVPHGAVVPYFVFQYNPPYTIPIVRRNEIAVPVLAPGEVPAKLEEEWIADDAVDEDEPFIEAPSDVE